MSEEVFVAFIKRYAMTKEQLEENGYPVEDPDVVGGAIVSNKSFYRNSAPQPKDPFKRRSVAVSGFFFSLFRSQTVEINLVLPRAAHLIFIGKTVMLHLLEGHV